MTTVQSAQTADGQTLSVRLQTPTLKQERLELEAKLKTCPTQSLRFRKLTDELFQLNQRIQKAQAQDDLLTWQALANIGGLL